MWKKYPAKVLLFPRELLPTFTTNRLLLGCIVVVQRGSISVHFVLFKRSDKICEVPESCGQDLEKWGSRHRWLISDNLWGFKIGLFLWEQEPYKTINGYSWSQWGEKFLYLISQEASPLFISTSATCSKLRELSFLHEFPKTTAIKWRKAFNKLQLHLGIFLQLSTKSLSPSPQEMAFYQKEKKMKTMVVAKQKPLQENHFARWPVCNQSDLVKKKWLRMTQLWGWRSDVKGKSQSCSGRKAIQVNWYLRSLWLL